VQQQNEQRLKRNQCRSNQMQRKISFLGFATMQPKETNKKTPEANQMVSSTQTQKFYFGDFS